MCEGGCKEKFQNTYYNNLQIKKFEVRLHHNRQLLTSLHRLYKVRPRTPQKRQQLNLTRLYIQYKNIVSENNTKESRKFLIMLQRQLC
jgi:hypothetical protein